MIGEDEGGGEIAAGGRRGEPVVKVGISRGWMGSGLTGVRGLGDDFPMGLRAAAIQTTEGCWLGPRVFIDPPHTSLHIPLRWK